ncbi:hypothetical protein [uncultured Mucilaginibacter sp.]|uniref:hypothetical protein n=1 Tax=uncultured Mucilaginibacter sp. TaxID=797541 RepID=UPI0025F0DF35|nr:hypothetical protein [uncultured Mucilaginibacter sp.]
MKNIPFFKLYLYSLFAAIPLSIFIAFLSLFHAFPIQFNDKPTFGIEGFIVCIVFTPFWVFLVNCLNWSALSFGRWLYILFCKVAKIKSDEISTEEDDLKAFISKGDQR